MHIPDGFLSAPVWAGLWVVSAGGVGYCLKKTARLLQDKMVPLMGVLSAFIFAAQMLNFPIAGGTSGHFLGGVLAAVMLGPYTAAVCLACVLIVQCLIFQDGGLTALGANIFNMSIVGTMGGYLIYKFIRQLFRKRGGILVASAVAGWFSIMAAAAMCALELGISGTSALNIALPAMLGVHALIGAGEAVITVLVLEFVLRVRPDLVYKGGR